ncbi:MAG: hypothetical protein KAX19_05030, partial [Candidatus Brocadiae bacterium]|nr:hypothetical protein [Candidatus Brocadiia bacterium]
MLLMAGQASVAAEQQDRQADVPALTWVLYAVDSSSHLMRVDPFTGKVTRIGKLNVRLPGIYDGLDFGMDGKLYLSDSWKGCIYSVDPQTAEAAIVRGPSGLYAFENMTFTPVGVPSPGGGWFEPGTALCSTGGLVCAVDLQSGTVDYIGDTGEDDDAYAISPDGLLYAIDGNEDDGSG